MKSKLLKRDDGRPYGFIVYGMNFRQLCRSISQLPGVVFTSRRRFFWSAEDIRASFSFKGYEFAITPDSWDDALWILPVEKDSTHQEVQEIFDYLERPG